MQFSTCFLVIKDWYVNNVNSHLLGGMAYKLTANWLCPPPGRYYIYAQIYYHNRNGRRRFLLHWRGVQPESWWRHHIDCCVHHKNLHVENSQLLWRVFDLSFIIVVRRQIYAAIAAAPWLGTVKFKVAWLIVVTRFCRRHLFLKSVSVYSLLKSLLNI